MNLNRSYSGFFCLIFILCMFQNQLVAQVSWNFTTSSATNVPANLTASSVTQVNNNGSTVFLAASSPLSTGYLGASAGNNGNLSAKTGTLNTGTSSYVQAVLTPLAGYQVKVTGIQWSNYSIGTSGPTDLSIYSSSDNYTTALATVTALQNSSWAVLSSAIYLSGTVGTPITFRIYASGGTGTTPAAGTANWRIDDLQISAEANPVRQKIYMSMKSADPSAPAPWNNITATSSINLLDSNGVATTVGIEFLGTIWNAGDQGTVTGNNSGVFPDAVIRDYFWFGAYGNPETITVNMKGLNPANKYKVTILGSSSWTGLGNNGTTVYTISEFQEPLYVDNNSSNTVTFNEIKPNAAGIVSLHMSKGTATPYGVINAIVIEKSFDGNVASSWNYNGNTLGAVQKIGTINNFDLPVITNNTEKMRVTAAGNIGIGTSTPNPNAKLDVIGNIFASGKVIIGTEGLTGIDYTNKIGAHALAVNGSAIFTKVKVKLYTEWADYVFDPGYKLNSLSFLEQYIKNNRHLPDMPSANDVKANGIDIGDNQAVLLKKVEELTLYIIALNKKVEELTKETNSLKKRNK